MSALAVSPVYVPVSKHGLYNLTSVQVVSSFCVDPHYSALPEAPSEPHYPTPTCSQSAVVPFISLRGPDLGALSHGIKPTQEPAVLSSTDGANSTC